MEAPGAGSWCLSPSARQECPCAWSHSINDSVARMWPCLSKLGWRILKHLTDHAPGSTSKSGCEITAASGSVDTSIALKCFGQILIVFTQVNLWLWVLPEGFVSQIGALTSKEPCSSKPKPTRKLLWANYKECLLSFLSSHNIVFLSTFCWAVKIFCKMIFLSRWKSTPLSTIFFYCSSETGFITEEIRAGKVHQLQTVYSKSAQIAGRVFEFLLQLKLKCRMQLLIFQRHEWCRP